MKQTKVEVAQDLVLQENNIYCPKTPMQRYKPKQKLEGLGDVIAMITYYTKLDLLANWFAVKVLGKNDCGCTRRKKKLNKLFKFK